MFKIDELREFMASKDFSIVKANLDMFLLKNRLGIQTYILNNNMVNTLSYFASAVIGSVSLENDEDEREWRDLCQIAADIEYGLYILTKMQTDSKTNDYDRLRRASILYEIAGLPGVAATTLSPQLFSPTLYSFFSRKRDSAFGYLKTDNEPLLTNYYENSNRNYDNVRTHDSNVAQKGVDETLNILADYMQNFKEDSYENAITGASLIAFASKHFNFNISADEATALMRVIKKRGNSSISRFISKGMLPDIIKAGLPAELWPVQQHAIKGGMFSEEFKSWGLASPTGTGKTSLAQLLLIDFFHKHPGKKAFYIVPSRALSAQVAKDLTTVLKPLGLKVGALGSHLTYHEHVVYDPKDMDVLVFTPEKADLIIRIEPELLKETLLVIVDEAHHIESGTRGILLEFYLWRLRSLVSSLCRIVQLSAVAPNINELVGWLREHSASSYVKLDWRTGRLRIGIFEREVNGSGTLSFNDDLEINLFSSGSLPNNINESLAILADTLADTGIILVLATSKGEAEELARLIAEVRSSKEKVNDTKEKSYCIERLDARLERELYAEIPLREYISKGVVYHHAGLPSRVRAAVEQVIAERKVNIVCATTTLAEGVNFPFSTVIVQSLIVGKSTTLSPRELWNIAGRAGRFGVDIEGHCILFRPSVWMHKLKGYRIEDYLNSSLDGIPPVKSALAKSLEETKLVVEKGELKLEDLESIPLGQINSNLSKDHAQVVRGMINMIRVSLAHAHVNGMINVNDPQSEPTVKKLFAYSQISESTKKFACKIEMQQRKTISTTLVNDNNLLKIAAKIGWTLESQAALWSWVQSLEDWKIQAFGNSVKIGEVIQPDNLKYLLYPIASLMSEFEGKTLGGFTAYIARHWIEGHPLTIIRERSTKPGKRPKDYSTLVDLIYSKIQYLLPWALYGVNELIQYEALRRRISVGSGIRDLSILASEGVPNFDALTLVMMLDIERVDATRLSKSFARYKLKDTSIIGWFKGLPWSTVAGIISGSDRRRLDPDLKIIHDNLQKDDSDLSNR